MCWDSPIDVFQQQIESEIKEGLLTCTEKWGFHINEEKLYRILIGDKERYEEAYARGYAAGLKEGDGYAEEHAEDDG